MLNHKEIWDTVWGISWPEIMKDVLKFMTIPSHSGSDEISPTWDFFCVFGQNGVQPGLFVDLDQIWDFLSFFKGLSC
jgi:hypothetical protein